MRIALLALALMLLAADGRLSSDALPGRDGGYQFANPSVEGTVWEGKMIPEASLIIRFERGGVLWYKYSNGQIGPSRKGSWKQTGDSIWMETNGKYAEYRAVVQGNRMVGEASNVTKLEMDF